LKSILFGYYKPKGSLDIKFDLRNNKLNIAQKEAISKSLQSKDFHLILGPPGTGKTTLIKELVEQNMKQGYRVLLTSWMNVAVDNALESIIDGKSINSNDICRIGAGDYKIAEKVLPFSLSDDFIKELPNKKLVGVTLAGAYRSMIGSGKKFDLVIVDEAGSSTVPQTLLALDIADKFILIGDHLQLPPIVKDKSMKWMTISLFENLWKMYPEKHSMLNVQYRMNPNIAKIASELVYTKLGGITSDESLISRATPFDTIDTNKFTLSEKKIMCKNLPICWIEVNGDTQWRRIGRDSSAKNIDEIGKIKHVVKLLIQSGIEHNKIGILSTYRLQLSTLINEFEDYIDKGLSVDTIHSFQGNEKEIIIISLVEKNSKAKIFSDIRLLNVALTRAKFKLIIVGNDKIANDTNETSEGFLKIWRYANRDFEGMNGVISPDSFEAMDMEKLYEKSLKENRFMETIEQNKKEKMKFGLR
jgi:DNA replication ATP-dependent helicase Dna2